jgi:hypothetical protein
VAEKQVMEDLAAMCPTNIKEPNFGRWGTISYVAKIVLHHWLPLFYMAQNVRDTEKNGCYLHVIATKLVELMSSKADPKQQTPTHYASLQWIVGFGGAMFDGNMEWAKRNDPVFGDGSYGHIARLLPEHIYVMERQLNDIKDGGWRDMKEFEGFIESVDGINNMGKIEKCGKEFFERLPTLFLERFEQQFKVHTRKWIHAKTIPIIIAGHPSIAKAYIRWIFNADTNFPTNEITLKHHFMGREQIKVKINEFMNWLISHYSDEERDSMQSDSLVQSIINELKEVAESDTIIDLLDRSTWGNNLIWNTIAPRAAHQQRVENLVQTAGFLGKTHVNEARQTARSKIHCLYYRDFKTWSLKVVRKRRLDAIKKKKAQAEKAKAQRDAANPNTTAPTAQTTNQSTQQPKKITAPKIEEKLHKVEGGLYLEMFSQWIDMKTDKIDIARAELGSDKMKEIITHSMKHHKISASDDQTKLDRFKKATNASKNRVVASKHFADVTCWMEGSVILSYLTKKDGARPFLMAEINHRKIPFPKPKKAVKDMTKAEKEKHKQKWNGMNEQELRHELRDHERARLEKEEDQVFAKVSDVKTIKPLSKKLRDWMPKQWEIYKKKKGLEGVGDEPE